MLLRSLSHFATLLFLAPFLNGCDSSPLSGLFGNINISSVEEPLNVEPVYSANSNWNDYVKNDEPNMDPNHQDDVSCDGSEGGYYTSCIHAGEKRKVEATGYPTCENLSLSDQLEVFDWECEVENGVATFFTTRIKENKGLRDLITSSGWIPNKVTLRESSVIVKESELKVWSWTNPLIPLPSNGNGGAVENLSTSGAIYYISSDQTTNGYSIQADKVSLITLDDSKLTLGDLAVNNCNPADGTTTAPSSVVLVCIPSRKFLWIEGSFNGGGSALTANRAVVLSGTTVFSKVHNSYAEEFEDSFFGFYAAGTASNYFYNISGYNGLSKLAWFAGGSHHNMLKKGFAYFVEEGIALTNTTFNKVDELVIANGNNSVATNVGVRMFGAGASAPTDNTFNNIKIYNMRGNADADFTGHGIIIGNGSSNNTFTNLLISNTNGDGIVLTGNTSQNTFLNVSTFRNGNFSGSAHGHGIRAYNTSIQNTIVQVAAVGNGITGLRLDENSANNQIFNFAGDRNANEIHLTGDTTGNYFGGKLIVGTGNGNGAGGRCLNSSSAGDAGVINNNCTDTGGNGTNTYTGQSSDALLTTGTDTSTTFIGPVTLDNTNQSHTSGANSFAAITDWLNFDNPFRVWGTDTVGGTWPEDNNWGDCTPTDSNCRIWDWRIQSTDTVYRNINGAFSAGTTCPASVHGDIVIQDLQSTTNTFLVHASEIIADDIGDDDGLCESNEACIYSPNIGAYQGEGDFTTQTCIFQNSSGGGVDGVTMYAYPQNGASP